MTVNCPGWGSEATTNHDAPSCLTAGIRFWCYIYSIVLFQNVNLFITSPQNRNLVEHQDGLLESWDNQAYSFLCDIQLTSFLDIVSLHVVQKTFFNCSQFVSMWINEHPGLSQCFCVISVQLHTSPLLRLSAICCDQVMVHQNRYDRSLSNPVTLIGIPDSQFKSLPQRLTYI